MAEQRNEPETLSTEGRKLIGQAIIDGILSVKQVGALARLASDYNQSGGNYTQRGGDHKQGGGGDYNQAPSRSIFDPVILEIRSGSVIRE